ncbi:MAG: hypothetical protein KBA30_06990 [Clostridia bacterium]|nr:hypothetical protein [Clostridia bacterium]
MACWFCSIRAAEANHMLETDLYGDVDALKSYDQTKVAYNVRHIGIPRCGDCHARHRVAKAARLFAVLAALSLIAAAVAIGLGWFAELYMGLWAGLSVGLMVGGMIAARVVQKGIHTERKSLKFYPEIMELKEKGYRFGLQPRRTKPKPQAPATPAASAVQVPSSPAPAKTQSAPPPPSDRDE